MELVSEVRRVLLTHHVISHRHAKFIENSLKAVNNGLKTGFIWDIGSPVTVSQVKDILDQLKLANILYEHIILVTIKDEICILNKRLFLEFKIAPLFIDVSEILSEPNILCLNTNEHIMEMINLVTTQIADTSGNILELKVDEEIYCIPSVLGILAGYPIVYWYDPIHSKEKQCLTDIDLIVFKVFDENSPILSFSVPKSLSETEEVQDKINAWKKEMKDFANYRIETSVQHTNNSICL